MSNISKIELAMLFDVYGDLLTKKQRNILQLFCNFDYSLGEIAQNLSISRQAAHDAIAVSEKSLVQFEQKLQILQQNKKFSDILNQANQLLCENNLHQLKTLLQKALSEENS